MQIWNMLTITMSFSGVYFRKVKNKDNMKNIRSSEEAL